MARKRQQEPRGLSEQLRELLKGTGLTLAELEERTGVDKGRLSRFINGHRGLSLDAIDAIFRALNISLTEQPAAD